MSKRSEGLITESLDNRWSFISNPALGATVNGSVSAPINSKACLVLDQLSYSIRNQSGAAHTCTISVRDGSVGATVLASWDEFPAAASSSVRQFYGLGIKATPGAALHFTMDSIIASVRATVNATGWTNCVQR